VRIPEDLLARIQQQIDSRNAFTAAEPWTLSDWIRVVSERELRKMARSRRRRARHAARIDVQLQADGQAVGRA
jgi:hypothetical protein